MPRSYPATGHMARRFSRAHRRSLQTDRHSWHCCEPVERRLVLSTPNWDLLAPLMPAFDWDIERTEATRLAAEDGPESTSIVWANRGTTDNFGIFGTSANAARNVVDAALDAWERVITNWNRSDGTTTLQINISMNTAGSGFGASGAPDAVAPADGKPRTGAITLGRGNNSVDPNDSNGWYFDPSPLDNSEFLGTLDSAFCGTAPSAVGPDLFSVVVHETSHVLGMVSDPNNSGGSWQGYLLENYATNTGIVDNAEGGGVYGHFYAFNGGSVDHVMTSYNSGDATASSWGNVVHTAGSGANFNWNGQNWRGAEDVGNAIYNSNQRIPPDWVLSHILADAYNYTIVDPNTFGTFYATLIQSTGELRVRGPTGAASSADLFVVSSSGSQITVSVDAGVDTPGTGALSGAGNLPAWVSVFNAADVGYIRIYGGDGVDAIRIEGNAGKPVYAYGDEGDDYLDLSYYAGNLGNISGGVSMYGGAGNDTMWVYDDYVSTPFTYSIDSAYVTRPGFGGAYYGADVEGLTVQTTSGADTINITSTYAATPLTVRTSGGLDTVNIGNLTYGAQGITSNVWIENANSFTVVNVDNQADATARTIFMSNDGTWGRITGLAPAGIYWKQADVQSVKITAGTAADTFNLQRTSEGVAYDGHDGFDTVNIGEGGSTANLGGSGITLRNVHSYNDIYVSNAGQSIAQAVSMGRGNLDGIVFGILSGIAAPTISYVASDTRDVNVTLSSGNNTVSVLATNGTGAVRIAGAGGADVITVGDAQNLDNITTRLYLSNPPAYSDLVLNDSADASADSISISRVSENSVNYVRVVGLAPAWIQYRVGDWRNVSYTTGSAADTVLIGVTTGSGATNLNSAGGGDVVTLGDSTNGARLIAAPLYVRNTPSFTTLTIDNAADTVGRSIVFDRVTLDAIDYDRITGIALSWIYLDLGDFNSPVTVEAGSGADTIAIRQTNVLPTFALHGNGGSDTFVVGNTDNTVDASDAALVIDGGAGSNTLAFNDQGNGLSQGFTITATSVTHPGMGTASYANLDRVTVNGTSGGATHVVNGTATTTPVAVNAGRATDTIQVVETGFPSGVSLGGTLSGDSVYINADDAGVANATLTDSATLAAMEIGAGGFLTLTPNGSNILRVNSNLIDRGRLDIADNAIIVDYSGIVLLSTYQNLLAKGYNGGAWNGTDPAIISTVAATGARSNDAVGYATALDLGSPFTWLGQSIDSTCVLIRYTLYGDANLDRVTNLSDFSTLAASFNATGTRWSKGNFNYDSATNIADFSLMATNFNTSLPAATPAASVFGQVRIGEGTDPVLA